MHNGKTVLVNLWPADCRFLCLLVDSFCFHCRLVLASDVRLNMIKLQYHFSPVVFKDKSIKQQALSKCYHPLCSILLVLVELRRMDGFPHPPVMAARYHNYTPFLFGSRGTQSLPQILCHINSMENADER